MTIYFYVKNCHIKVIISKIGKEHYSGKILYKGVSAGLFRISSAIVSKSLYELKQTDQHILLALRQIAIHPAA